MGPGAEGRLQSVNICPLPSDCCHLSPENIRYVLDICLSDYLKAMIMKCKIKYQLFTMDGIHVIRHQMYSDFLSPPSAPCSMHSALRPHSSTPYSIRYSYFQRTD